MHMQCSTNGLFVNKCTNDCLATMLQSLLTRHRETIKDQRVHISYVFCWVLGTGPRIWNQVSKGHLEVDEFITSVFEAKGQPQVDGFITLVFWGQIFDIRFRLLNVRFQTKQKKNLTSNGLKRGLPHSRRSYQSFENRYWAQKASASDLKSITRD